MRRLKITNTVLLTDDEKWALDDITNIVDWGEYGFDKIITASEFRDAKRKIQIHVPDLLVCDIRIKNDNGLELLEFAKTVNSNIICIIISAYDDFAYIQRALRGQAFDYLLKPIDKAQLENDLSRIRDILKELKLKKIVYGTEHGGDRNIILDKIIAYIKNNISRMIVMRELEEEFHLAYTSINKLFLDNMGTTVKNYIITAKIEYAMELIKNTDMLFSEISELVGYSDNFHFSKIFKKHTGFTPTEYKNFSHNK